MLTYCGDIGPLPGRPLDHSHVIWPAATMIVPKILIFFRELTASTFLLKYELLITFFSPSSFVVPVQA